MRKILIFIGIATLLVWWCNDVNRVQKETERAENEKLQKIYNEYYSKLTIEQKDGLTYYYNSYFTHKNNYNGLSVYIRRFSNNKPYLRLKISSNKISATEADYIYLYADDKTMEIPIGDIYQIEKVKGGAYIDLQIGEMLTEHLADMAKAYSASVKFFGYSSGNIQQYYLTKEQQDGINQVLNGYKYLLYIQP